jgi:hypothetical protein
MIEMIEMIEFVLINYHLEFTRFQLFLIKFKLYYLEFHKHLNP